MPTGRGCIIGSTFHNPSRLELSLPGPWFSLSLRERAGVRGNVLWKLQAVGVSQLAPETGTLAGRNPKSEGRMTNDERQSENREAIAKVALLWLSHAPFPLTPALSLREREHRRSAFDNPSRLGLSQRGPWFSLSLRERGGVRGNALWKVKTMGVLQLALEGRK